MLPYSPLKSILLPVVRLLIGSYFLAGIGLIDSFAGVDLLSVVIPVELAEMVTAFVLYGTSLAVMLGIFVRPAALILAVFFFWSSYLQYAPDFTLANLTGFWQDMALVGAVLLIAEISPERRLRMRRTTPRRLNVVRNPIDGRPQLRQDARADARVAAALRTPRPTTEASDNIFRDQPI